MIHICSRPILRHAPFVRMGRPLIGGPFSRPCFWNASQFRLFLGEQAHQRLPVGVVRLPREQMPVVLDIEVGYRLFDAVGHGLTSAQPPPAASQDNIQLMR